jgi:hypothetical protein
MLSRYYLIRLHEILIIHMLMIELAKLLPVLMVLLSPLLLDSDKIILFFKFWVNVRGRPLEKYACDPTDQDVECNGGNTKNVEP